MGAEERPTVLILGAGINGCALARELVLNGLGVWVVDRHDIAFGATSRSSRLIHGGLRYLEHGDFHLVRESLVERSLLRRLAPQFVEPVPLFIPISRRTGGMFRAAIRILGLQRIRWMERWLAGRDRGGERGLWVVRLGLWLYDRFARDPAFDPHRVGPVGAADAPQVDRARYRWLCAYTDAQMRFPERFVIALCEDTRTLARQRGTDFRVLTRHTARWRDRSIEIQSTSDDSAFCRIRPSGVVNATGAWGDLTLDEIDVPSPRLLGGTKGSHFVSFQSRLRHAIGDAGVYAEAEDGRLIFVLPFGKGVLVGTTDIRFDDRPERAVASSSELDYLLEMVNALFPGVELRADEVDLHYSGVRPLPYVSDGSTATISRGHWVAVEEKDGIPVLTLVGGKLTTCRAFAAHVADMLFDSLKVPRRRESTGRVVPGGIDYPSSEQAIAACCGQIGGRYGLETQQVRAMWTLCGNRVEQILAALGDVPPSCLYGTSLPMKYVRWVIENEWVGTLEDLVERRLMLVFEPTLHERTLRQLAECLADSGRLASEQVPQTVSRMVQRLQHHYGRRVQPSDADDAGSSPVTA